MTTNLAFLRWLVAHPLVRAGNTTTAFLAEHPPLSETTLRTPEAVWTRAWRLNLPPAPHQAPPQVDAAGEQCLTSGQSSLNAPMPGTVLKVYAAPGDSVVARQPLIVLGQ